MSNTISGQALSKLMASDALFAVFDVRERGEYNDCQIPNTTSLPRSQIEFRVGELVPNRTIPIVVYDEGGKRAEFRAEFFNLTNTPMWGRPSNDISSGNFGRTTTVGNDGRGSARDAGSGERQIRFGVRFQF